MTTNIKQLKKGQLIRFRKHSHIVINQEIDCSGLYGEVVEVHKRQNNKYLPDNFEVHIELKTNRFEHTLKEWDNCLIFNFF